MCKECYSDNNRITPLLNPIECLENHTQYICGTRGRCICIECDKKRGLQRWNFPFKSFEIVKLYLRTADYTIKKSCGIYEIKDKNNRKTYKIFKDDEELYIYLKKNKNKIYEKMNPIFKVKEYIEYLNTKVKRLSKVEIEKYMEERYKEKNNK